MFILHVKWWNKINKTHMNGRSLSWIVVPFVQTKNVDMQFAFIGPCINWNYMPTSMNYYVKCTRNWIEFCAFSLFFFFVFSLNVSMFRWRPVGIISQVEFTWIIWLSTKYSAQWACFNWSTKNHDLNRFRVMMNPLSTINRQLTVWYLIRNNFIYLQQRVCYSSLPSVIFLSH